MKWEVDRIQNQERRNRLAVLICLGLFAINTGFGQAPIRPAIGRPVARPANEIKREAVRVNPPINAGVAPINPAPVNNGPAPVANPNVGALAGPNNVGGPRGFGRNEPNLGACLVNPYPFPTYGSTRCLQSSTLFVFGAPTYFGNPYFGTYYPLNSPGYIDPFFLGLQNNNDQLRQQLLEANDANQRLQEINRRLADGDEKEPAKRKGADALLEAQKKDRQERARQRNLSGLRLLAAGSYVRAAERFREAVRQAPDDASSHFYLAQALFAQKRYAEASRAVKSGLLANASWLEADFDMRTVYGDANDFLPQMAALVRHLKANPLDRDALFLLGFELFVTDQKDKAREILDQSAKLDTTDAHLAPFFDYYRKRPEKVAKGG